MLPANDTNDRLVRKDTTYNCGYKKLHILLFMIYNPCIKEPFVLYHERINAKRESAYIAG